MESSQIFQVRFGGEGLDPFAAQGYLTPAMVQSAQSGNKADQKSVIMLLVRADSSGKIKTAFSKGGDADFRWEDAWACIESIG